MSANWILAVVLCLFLSINAAASLNVKDFGAVGDGSKDDSASIQKALDASEAAGGGTVRLPTGKYRLDGPITVPSGVTLAGEWEAPHHAQLAKGTVIHAYAGKGSEDGPPLVNLSPSSTIKGVTFFYPEQRVPNASPYPWTIQGKGMHCSVIDVTLVNAYKGIDFGTHWNELHYIRNVFGCPLKVGVYVDKCSDIGRIENVHFNPHYWMRSEAEGVPTWEELRKYLWENCTAFDIGRTDWEYMLNTFSFGCKVGIRFFRSNDGMCNGNFLGVGIDWAQTAILVEHTQEPGLLFTNAEIVGGEGAETMVRVTETHGGVVQFSNSSFWGPSKRIAQIAGNGMVSFSQCNFVNWDLKREGIYAIEANDGDVMFQGNRFAHGTNHILLGENVKTAVISGNMTAQSAKFESKSTGDVQVYGNVSRKKAE